MFWMGWAPGVIADGICRVVKDSAILFALRDDGGSCLWPQVDVSGKEPAAGQGEITFSQGSRKSLTGYRLSIPRPANWSGVRRKGTGRAVKK